MTVSRHTSPAVPPTAPMTQLEALQRAIPELLGVDPVQALALARTCCGLSAELDTAQHSASELLLGRAFQANAQLTEALEAFQRVASTYECLGMMGQEAEARTLAGKVCIDLGQFDDASRELEGAVALAADIPSAISTHATALNHLAVVKHHQGQAAEALQLMHRALQFP